MTTDLDYYLQKVADMQAFAAKAKDQQAKLEFEHLAQEYECLAKHAQKASESQQA